MKNIKINFLMSFVLIIFSMTSFAQIRQVKGHIIDTDGEPIIGATIICETNKKTIGAISDINGNYLITIPEKAKILKYSFVGKKPQEVFINSRSIIDIVLEEDKSLEMEDVVVVGYGKAMKKDLTGSISIINSEKIMLAQPSTIDQALKGKMAGVQIIQTDGTPGGSVSIKIRGTNSINAGSAPLYVVDGFPIPYSNDPAINPLTSIAPSSIENITVLKDASSTAIYGAQGANGVVLITTKKAQIGMNDLNINVTTGIGKMTNYAKVLSPKAYLENLMFSNYRAQDADMMDKYYAEAWNDQSQISDWVNLTTQNSINRTIEANYLGSIANKIRNTTSVSYSDDEGALKNSGFKRLYFVQNIDIIVSKKWNINTIISYERGERYGANWIDGSIFNDMLTFSPFIPKEWSWKEMDEYLIYNSGSNNPYTRVTEQQYNRKNSNLYASANVKYNFLGNLSLTMNYSFGRQNAESRTYKSKKIKSSYDKNGYASLENNIWNNWRYLIQLDYFLHRNNNHFTATAAFECSKQTSDSYSKSYTDFATDLGWYGINGAKASLNVSPPYIGYNDRRMSSALARFTYNYKDIYYATINFRADGSSRFNPMERWGFFPSGAISWRISNMKFMQKNEWIKKNINDMKIRLGYGIVGNDQIDDYQYFSFISPTAQLPNFSSLGAINNGIYSDVKYVTTTPYHLSGMSNSKIKWEVSKEFNLGLDANLFNNKVILNLDLYYKKTNDMLLKEQIPLTSGFQTVFRNMGSIRNKGLEISITFSPVNTKNCNYDVSVVYSANRTKVLDLGSRNQVLVGRGIGNSSSENIMIKEGYPLGIYYGTILNGIANSQISNYNALPSGFGAIKPNTSYNSNIDLYRKEVPSGKFMFDDLDGDGYVYTNDRAPIAYVEPAFIGGMTHTLRYKIFTLNANFSWSYGNDIINGNVYSLINAGFGINNKLASIAGNIWATNNNNGTYSGDGNYRNHSNSELVEDGSFFRLNNLSLTADLPEKWLKKLKMKHVSLTYTMRNVFCLTRYSGYDPEVNSGSSNDNKILSGVDYSSYPTTRSNIFSLNLKF